MGVTGLWKLIDQSGKPVPLDTLENKVLAVDISIWLHQVVKGFQDSSGATLPNAHLLGLFHRLCKLMYYRIKPVFVFDGGVPPLKRETIAKRARNKNKYQTEADKLQYLLLEALAKEKVVQQALGPSTSALISPRKPIQKASNTEDENDMFKLPPMLEVSKDESFTDVSESDGSFDEKHQRTHYNHNLQAIDVKSSHFQSLPADIRHEILSDIKETRKQSSWGRLHELPVESQSFSSFQMKRLLKRRQVQVELEEAEKEMGGKGLSMAELENLLSEEGVVDPDIATERVASNEHVRFLHVRDITKALQKDAEQKVKLEKLEVIEEEIKDEIDHDIKLEKNEFSNILKTEGLTEEEIDLQRAIQLSLGGDDLLQDECEEDDVVRLTVDQRKALGSAANSLARHYMVEYGGMNDEEVSDLVKIDTNLDETQEFKYNDVSILGNTSTSATASTSVASEKKSPEKEVAKNTNTNSEKGLNMSESSSDGDDVSSNADSDFIDVPDQSEEEDDIFFARAQRPLPPPFHMNEPNFRVPIGSEPNLNVSDTKIEVVINPGHISEVGDDLFADIFDKPAEPVPEKSKTECIEIADSPVKGKQHSISVVQDTPSSSGSKIQNILSILENEKSSITKLSLDDILGAKPGVSKKSQDLAFLTEFEKKQETPADLEEKLTTPTKISQPFFVKKTPPSSKKKSPGSAKLSDTEKTPSKAAKSLTEAFESIPSTSSAVISEKDSMEMAANVLREKKSKEELEDIADQLNQERRDLIAERNKKDRMGVSITEQMSAECMELLRLFGVPYIVAPMEAEAQCAYLNEINLTEGTITDDSDIWLFGGQTVYKNFFDQNKHVLEFRSENIQRLFHLDRPKLIQLSFLVGSDYTQGIHGIGAVTALEVLSIFPPTPEKEGETTQVVSILSSLRKFRDWWQNKGAIQRANVLRNKLKNITITEDFPNIRVVEAYLYPTVDENREKFSWGMPEPETIREYARKTFGWTNKRTDEIVLPVVKRLSEKTSQQSIQNYFKITGVTTKKDLKVSKRVRTALQQMSGEPDASLADEVIEKKKPKKRSTKFTKEVEKKDDDDDDVSEKVKPKPGRKRKVVPEQTPLANDNEEPSTSSNNGDGKKVMLPDNNAPIPQREKDKQLMESNKLKAIEVLKKMKAGKKK